MAKPAKTGKSKARVGHGRLRRISKADVKRAMLSETRRQIRRVRHRLRPYEVAELATNDLPFTVRRDTMIFPTYDGDGPRPEDYTWSAAECAIADAALRRGYRLFVRCPPDGIALYTAQMMRQLKAPVHVCWNVVHRILMLWVLEDNQVHDDESASQES